MGALGLLLLLAAAQRLELVDQDYQIPANDWRYVPVILKQQTAAVIASYTASGASEEIRAVLVTTEDIERLRQDRPHGFLIATTPASSGRFRFHVPTPGEYAILLDNRGEHPARVHLRVALDFSGLPEPRVRYLSKERQLTVIAVSFLVFFGIVAYSGRRLWRKMVRGS